jgi:hypothetical protein
MDYSALISLALGAIGGVVWLVRLEGRINVLAAQMASAEKRVDSLESQILDKLERIDNKLDRKADR